MNPGLVRDPRKSLNKRREQLPPNTECTAMSASLLYGFLSFIIWGAVGKTARIFNPRQFCNVHLFSKLYKQEKANRFINYGLS